jgi:hypothetical protein
MQMHPSDYLDITGWATQQFALLDTPTLRRLHRRAPGPFQVVIENVLHQRGESAWSFDAWAGIAAEAEWHALWQRLGE